MWIIFDLIVIVIIALSTFIGYKQGLIKSAIKILSFFIAIIVAFTLYKPVSKIIINNTSIDESINNAMVEKIKIGDNVEENENELDFIKQIENKVVGTTQNAIEDTANVLTTKIIEIATLLLLFIVVKIVLLVVSLITDFISKLPVLKQLNKTGGIIYGIIRGIILVYTILAVVYLITPLLTNNINDNINKTVVTKRLYNNNFILNIIIK